MLRGFSAECVAICLHVRRTGLIQQRRENYLLRENCRILSRSPLSIVFQIKILGLADSELAKVAIFVEESPKHLS